MSELCQRKRKPRGRLTEDQRTLAERYMPLARSLAKPHKRRSPNDWEEYESAALLALIEAAEAFQPDRDVKFSTFAHKRIWGALQDVRRRKRTRAIQARRAASAVQISSAPRDHDSHGRVLLMQPCRPVGTEFEANDEVETWFRKLPKRHAAACRQIYLQGKTHAETAEALGLSASRVTYMHQEAMAMLNGTWEGRRPNFARGTRRPN